jgi:hypothetical protein
MARSTNFPCVDNRGRGPKTDTSVAIRAVLIQFEFASAICVSVIHSVHRIRGPRWQELCYVRLLCTILQACFEDAAYSDMMVKGHFRVPSLESRVAAQEFQVVVWMSFGRLRPRHASLRDDMQPCDWKLRDRNGLLFRMFARELAVGCRCKNAAKNAAAAV